MSNIGAGIYTKLTGNGTVAGLVSARVYPLILPQKPTLPAVAYQQVSDGANEGTTSLHGQWYQFGCFALTYAGAQALANAVEAALEEEPGVGWKSCYRIGRNDDYDVATDSIRVTVDVRFSIC